MQTGVLLAALTVFTACSKQQAGGGCTDRDVARWADSALDIQLPLMAELSRVPWGDCEAANRAILPLEPAAARAEKRFDKIGEEIEACGSGYRKRFVIAWASDPRAQPLVERTHKAYDAFDECKPTTLPGRARLQPRGRCTGP